MLSLPGCVVVAMTTGPLAWDGVFSYYLPGLALIVWMIGTTVVLLKSIKARGGRRKSAGRDAVTAASTVPGEPSARRIPGESGTWVFLFGDMLVFGVFFVTFMVERAKAPELFDVARTSLHIGVGVTNTLVLLTSSLCVVVALGAIRAGAKSIATNAVYAAIACGLLFMASRCSSMSRWPPARTVRAPTTSSSTTSS